ncbi:unnamed protein product [Paramecium octaurelia]|uniref:Uncharacterized protein n=1 Tax=Paramecium octaurelia TaxID=43137 RepID=A0A8S1VV19_PAROT|nr:unnamed protein product [Paramecium octaurelia]
MDKYQFINVISYHHLTDFFSSTNEILTNINIYFPLNIYNYYYFILSTVLHIFFSSWIFKVQSLHYKTNEALMKSLELNDLYKKYNSIIDESLGYTKNLKKIILRNCNNISFQDKQNFTMNSK